LSSFNVICTNEANGNGDVWQSGERSMGNFKSNPLDCKRLNTRSAGLVIGYRARKPLLIPKLNQLRNRNKTIYRS